MLDLLDKVAVMVIGHLLCGLLVGVLAAVLASPSGLTCWQTLAVYEAAFFLGITFSVLNVVLRPTAATQR